MTPLQRRGMLVPPGQSLGAAKPHPNPSPLSPTTAEHYQRGRGDPGAWTSQTFDANRFVLAGGQLASDILHPTTTPFEQLYRRLPEEGMYSPLVSPNNPFTFEIGAFTVPDRMSLLIFDLRPDIYRFSGVDAGDYVPIETRRFSSIMGFDLTIDQKRQGNTYFQLDPIAIQRSSQQAFQNNNAAHPSFNSGQYAIGAGNTFAASSGAATALLPQRPTRFGALTIPFTLIAKSKQTVQVRCVIYRPVPTPIAFIEYDIAGILVPEQWTNKMLEVGKPPVMRGEDEVR